MNKYQNAKIYKIVSNIHPLPYYGSTINSLKFRMQQHESAYRKKTYYAACHIFFDIGDYQIRLVENFPCNNRKELQKREDYYINKYPCINKRRASINQEYAEYFKQYRINNKERIRQINKQYYEKNRAKIKQNQKQYRINNKAKFNEYSKQYYQQNKAKLKQKFNKKFNCACGGRYTNANKARHLRTEKHKQYLIATV